MKLTISLTAALLLLVGTEARAQNSLQSDFSQILTTTPVMVIPSAASLNSALHYSYVHIENVGIAANQNGGPFTDAPTAWCSESLTTTLAPHAPGAIPLTPGGRVLDFNQSTTAHYVPNGPVWCVAAYGTVPLTAIAH